MNATSMTLLDAAGNAIAELAILDECDGWFSGRVAMSRFTPKLQEALDWHDEVVENQMLSYLDQATNAVDQFGFTVRAPNGATQKVFSLHVTKQGEISYRTSPVPPPAWLARSESA